MEDLRHVMRIVDENCTNLSEGDYLQVCNLLQKVYRQYENKEMLPLFDYERFNFYLASESEPTLDYFHNHFYVESIDLDIDFLENQLGYLDNEYQGFRPLKRITKDIKNDAITHYCWMYDIHLERYTPEHLKMYHDENGYDIGEPGTKFEKGLQEIYKSYFRMVNHYRELYRDALRARMEKISGWIGTLRDM